VHVYFAQEARTYALATLLALASVDVLLVAVRRPARRAPWIAYGALAFLTVYAHYYGAFVALAGLVFVVLGRRRRPGAVVPAIVALAASAALWLAAWAPAFVAQVTTKGNLSRAAETWHAHVLATPLVWSVGTTLVWKDTATAWRALAAAIALAAFGVPAIVGLLRLRGRPGAARLVLPWMLLPTAAPAAISLLLFPFYYVRYGLLASPAFYLLVAAGLVALRPRARLACGAAMAATAGLSIALYFTTAVKHEWRSAARWVDAHVRPGDVVAFDADIGEDPFARYTTAPNTRIRLLPPGWDGAEGAFVGARARRGATLDVTPTLLGAPRVWVVLSDPASGSHDHYRRVIDAEWRTLDVRRFRGIEVRLCEPRQRGRGLGPRARAGAAR
jgi:mannosyltransferase